MLRTSAPLFFLLVLGIGFGLGVVPCSGQPRMESGRLEVDGRPFFVVGIFLGPTQDEHLQRIARAGFNTVLAYEFGSSPEPEAFLDRAHAAGLKVLFSLKDLYEGAPNFPGGEPGLSQARSLILRLKSHPALLGWYINDELGPSFVPQLQQMVNLVHELDPGRPTLQVLCEPREFDRYRGLTDILGVDPYPIPDEHITLVSDWIDSARSSSDPRTAVWFVPQAFAWENYRGAGRGRDPSFIEMKSMVYLALAHGATGLIFYSYFDLWRGPDGQPVDQAHFDQHWRNMEGLIQDLRPLHDALVVQEPALMLSLPDSPVRVAMVGTGKERFLILVSVDSERPANARFDLPPFLGPGRFCDSNNQDGQSDCLQSGPAPTKVQMGPLEVRVFKWIPACDKLQETTSRSEGVTI